MSPKGLKSWCQQSHFLPEALGESWFPCHFQLPGATHSPWLMATSSISKHINRCRHCHISSSESPALLFFFFKIFIFSIIVDLHCSINFYCRAKWSSHVCVCVYTFFSSHYPHHVPSQVTRSCLSYKDASDDIRTTWITQATLPFWRSLIKSKKPILLHEVTCPGSGN